MKVVVTGATGHIGNVLVRKLIEHGYEVKSLAMNEKDGEILKDLKTEIVYGDVCKLETNLGRERRNLFSTQFLYFFVNLWPPLRVMVIC